METIEACDKGNMWLYRIDEAFTSDVEDSSGMISLYEYINLLTRTYESFESEYAQLKKLDIDGVICSVSYEESERSKWLKIDLSNVEATSIIPKSISQCSIHIVERCDGDVHALLLDGNGEVIPSTLRNVSSSVLIGYIELFRKYSSLFNFCEKLRSNDSLLIKRDHIQMSMTLNEFNKYLVIGLSCIEISFKNWLGNYAVDIKLDRVRNKEEHQILVNFDEYHGISLTELMKRIRIDKRFLGIDVSDTNKRITSII